MNGINNRKGKILRDPKIGVDRIRKRGAIASIWLALIGGVVFAITHAHDDGGIPAAGASGEMALPLVPSPSVLAAHWAEIVSHAAASPRGAPRARYSLVEFGDFQCPQCAHAQPLIAGLLTRCPGDVNLLFVQRPIPEVHCWALPAAQAAQIAAAQGKFWPMYDALYTHQDDLNPNAYLGYAAQAGISQAAFVGAVERGEGRREVAAAVQFSNTLGVKETPLLALRDNATGAVTEYLGIDGGEAPGDAGIPGLHALLASPLWAPHGAGK